MDIPFNYDGTDPNVFRYMEDRHKRMLISHFHRERFVLDMEPLEDALRGVNMLRKEGYSLVCLTSPWHTKLWEVERREWLKKHFGFKASDVIQTPKKTLVRGITLIDDKISHCQEWGVVNGSPALLFDTTYNREPITGRPNQLDVIRVCGWQEILTALEVM